MAKDKIKPELPGGFRDYLPEEMIPKQKMLDKIRSVFERFGFLPLDTPSIERTEILTQSSQNEDKEFNKQIYKIASNKKDKKLSDLALRFDLTVPLARVIAANPDIKKPFKGYQIGKVFRAESSQAGRYNEFTQCDADIIGSDNPMADAEIISLAYETLNSLGVENFIIKINFRTILNKVFEDAKIGIDKFETILKIIDKSEKIGLDNVEKELLKIISKEQTIRVMNFIRNKDVMGLSEFTDIKKNLINLGIPGTSISFEPSIVRGLSYYTGMVFEVMLNDLPEIGSICSGGRYDGLTERFSKNKISSVGMSVGIDRLFAALGKLGKIEKEKSVADALVLNFDESCSEQVQKITADLRKNNIKTELYLGKEDTFKGQLAYSVSREYPIVVIMGSKELDAGVAQIKNMKTREQKEIKLESITEYISELING